MFHGEVARRIVGALSIGLINLSVKCEVIVGVADPKQATCKQPYDPCANFSEIKAVDSKHAKECLQNPSYRIIVATRPVAVACALSHGGDKEEVDYPADPEEPEGEKPDESGDLASVIKSVSSKESKNPENITYGDRVSWRVGVV